MRQDKAYKSRIGYMIFVYLVAKIQIQDKDMKTAAKGLSLRLRAFALSETARIGRMSSSLLVALVHECDRQVVRSLKAIP